MKCSKIWLYLFFAALTGPVLAGLHPLHTLVVVNDNSTASQAIGHYYAQKRGIPDRNICHINTQPTQTILRAAFSNDILNPILNYIYNGFSNQITTIVLSHDIPYRVAAPESPSININSITAAIFYGIKDSSNSCALPAYTTNSYYEREYSFDSRHREIYTNQFICFMLTMPQEDASRRVIDRAVIADNLSDTNTKTVLLVHPDDSARAVQWVQYFGTDYLLRFLKAPLNRNILDTNIVTGATNVIGYVNGRMSLLYDLYQNNYAPGAIGHNLTSYGGDLYYAEDPYHNGQMRLTHWLEAGCAGSYGTCVEPCAYTEKFPDTRHLYWYTRGFSLGESLYMSVKNPYQGVFAGDPLTSPFAQKAVVSASGLPSTASGVVAIQVQAVSFSNVPLDRLDCYIDGQFLETLTNLLPTAGNVITARVGNITKTITVTNGETLYGLTQRLADSINNQHPPPKQYTASAMGDRIMIAQNYLGISAAGITSSISAAKGTATEQTTTAYSPTAFFLETQYPAYEQLYLTGTPVSGDVIRVVITTLDGQIITNEAVAAEGDNAIHLFEKLRDAVNQDIQLQSVYGCEIKYLDKQSYYSFLSYYQAFLFSRTNTYEGSNLHVDFQVIPTIGSDLDDTSFSDYFNDNADDLKGKAMFFLAVGNTNLNASFTLDTTQLADGPHTLTILAREGSGVGTWSSTTLPFRVSNTPLECQITTPVNLANYPDSETISITVTASSPNTITSLVLYVEGKQKALTNGVPWNTSISASNYGPGLLTIQTEAFDNAGNRALSDPVQLIIYKDSDADGLPDWWEYQHFGGSTNAAPSADPDADAADNLAEYTADTLPTNTASVFSADITSIPSTLNILLLWPGQSSRFYNVYYRDDLLTSSWIAAESSPLRGIEPLTAWTNSTVTNTHRTYRIKAIVP